MIPQLLRSISPVVLRLLGAGKAAGSLGNMLGPKAQFISPDMPDMSKLPTVPMSQSNLGQQVGSLTQAIQDFLQRKAATTDSRGGGYDEAGFTMQPPQRAPALAVPPMPPAINIPSMPVAPPSVSLPSMAPVPQPRPVPQNAYAQGNAGPDLIQKFLQTFHGAAPDLDRHAIKGW